MKKSTRKFSEKFDRHPTKQFQNSPNPCQTASRISDKYSPLKFILRIRKHFPLVYYFLNLKMGVFLPNSSRSLYSHFVLIEAFGVEKHPTPFVLCALFIQNTFHSRAFGLYLPHQIWAALTWVGTGLFATFYNGFILSGLVFSYPGQLIESYYYWQGFSDLVDNIYKLRK